MGLEVGSVERAEVDRRQSVGSAVEYDDAAARRGTPVCLRKAQSVQRLIACTRCAFSREANAIASVPRTTLHSYDRICMISWREVDV